MLELYHEEVPHLLPLPLVGFRYFTQGVRTVDDAGLVQIEGAYYAAGEAALASVVTGYTTFRGDMTNILLAPILFS